MRHANNLETSAPHVFQDFTYTKTNAFHNVLVGIIEMTQINNVQNAMENVKIVLDQMIINALVVILLLNS